ncbi:hypothetical protein Asppvi_005663 [Aspergillus pseudoviridinutans]|uniref:P-loop containing nucleoside triphosphate hydrolase protein n=1 Tax=Aspergillus pseudoviridinutans TaxID=1517512 RepID=A0A9P3EV72_9EURO|nr:uncharacterized protein Asppvi_005663 [Aspergillus pseudoviridinutans]GIJ86768.1 hypothetical protein Asppvi_005663 [Aspergillus pseudoviridinutans]
MESTPQILPGLQEPLFGQRNSSVLFLTQNVSPARVSAVGLLAVILLGAYADRYLIPIIWRSKRKTMRLLTEFYADQDGVATADSIKKASASAWNIHRLTGACVGLGGGISIAKIALSLRLQRRAVSVIDSLQVVIWAFLGLQCSALFLRLPAPAPYSIALRAALSCAVAVIVLFVQLNDLYDANEHLTLESLLIGLQIAASLCAIVSNLLVPRRPDLFHHGTPVDREYSTSYLGWLSFSWIAPWLKTMKTCTVRISNLPQLGYSLRAESALRTCFQMMSGGTAGAQGLWVVILRSELGLLSWQGIITLSSSLLGFVPQFAVMRILATLENDRQGERDEARLYTFLVLLCASTMVTAILDSLKYWISYGKLSIRVQQRLTVALFDKAVRRNVGPACSSKTGRAKGNNVDGPLNPISLAAVDAKTVADFVSMTFQLYETPAKLLVASVFLWNLLGWEGLLACGIVLVLTGCGNSYTVKRYSQSQRNLHQSRDQRLTLVTEVLRGIQHVKFAALEDRWEGRVGDLRGQEMRAQWSAYLWQTFLFSLYFLSPILLSVAGLGVALLRNRDLTATTAFTTITVLNSIEMSLSVLPDTVSMFANAFVSMQRLSLFFAEPDHVSSVMPSEVIEFREATLAWPSSPASLSGVNLRFPTGALSIITGATGTGKSLLLAAILGESDLLAGTISAPTPLYIQSETGQYSRGRVAYVPQAPWIERGTIRDNILFGTPFSADRYALVLFACALEKDLERLPAGDLTGIGTDGVNLSGGQRWRVSLARALYSPAQTLLLDDFFSAVDVHTRAHLHRHALMGEIARGRTRILVTHHVDVCLSSAEYLVSLGNGTAVAMSVEDARREQLGKVHPVVTVDNEGLQEPEPQIEHIQASRRDDEETAGLSWDALQAYAARGGSPFFWVLVIVSFVGYSGLLLGRAWCIKLWTSRNASTPEPDHLQYYLAVYLGLSLITGMVGITRCYLIICVAFRASQRLFNQMLHTILRAPLQWHAAVPSGRILARFSSDVSVIDSRLARDLRNTLDRVADVAMALAAGSFVSPLVLLVAAALVLLYHRFAHTYLRASRMLNRLTSAAKGPIYGHFDACLAGLPVIRAFGRVDAYRQSFLDKVDDHSRAYFSLRLLNRWLGFRINMIGAGFSAASAALIVSLRDVDAGTAGFALSFTMQISASIGLVIRYYAFLEQDMNSVERVREYARLETERYEGRDAPASWPTRGRIEVSDLAVRHAPHLPSVLQGITFRVEEGERVAVVGRTGAGKSSLVLALFRILEAAQGQILVDGIDISQLKLQMLRGRIAVIPQDPAIFRGTIRSNLDPFDEHEESELLEALESVRWTLDAPDASGERSPLDRLVAAGGSNLSQGQRQLLCIAREIVWRPKVLVLDEATSAVDKQSDRLIQQCVRTVFGGGSTTLLVVAHRLSTVADFDRILVLDAGRAVEFGTPLELMERENGIFREMVEQDQERVVLKEMIARGR